jgi:voltage-gated potassium channel Kch
VATTLADRRSRGRHDRRNWAFERAADVARRLLCHAVVITRFSRVLSTSFLALAGATILSACVEDPDSDPMPDEEGIAVDESGETGETPPDMPDPDEGETETEGETPPTCETTTAVASNVLPNVMLVLDKSRSMINYTWDDDGNSQTEDVTRWYSLHGTVESIATQYELGMNLGLTLFPSQAATSSFDEACLVSALPEVGTASGNAGAILAAIPAADSMDLWGATPAAAGLTTALAHLESLEDGRPAAMILITDGAANCGMGHEGSDLFNLYDEDVPLIVADAWERAGIPTYVIGIDIQTESLAPNTMPREKLDEVAQLGGVPRAGEVGFYDATSADILASALDEIASSVSCTVELGEAPDGPDQLVVSINGEELDQLTSCEQGDGWVFSNPDGALDSIELCNAACDALLEYGEVSAEFLCPPQP